MSFRIYGIDNKKENNVEKNIDNSIDNNKKNINKKWKGLKVSFYTLGCKVNQYETNAMVSIFENEGFKVVPWGSLSDVSVVNTCTVTNMSDRKSRQMLNKAKRDNPETVLICIGCYSELGKTKVIKQVPNVDIVLGNRDKSNILEFLEMFFENKKSNEKKIDLEEKADIEDWEFSKDSVDLIKEYEDFQYFSHNDKTRATIKIQDGCNRFCTYCIIPYVRGRIRSRRKKNILKEIKENVKMGVKEVVLTGIHISSYGKDFKKRKDIKNDEKIDLVDLIKEISKVDGLERVRLGSLEPRIIDMKFISELKNNKKLCPQFHLSLQSANNDTLKRMNRRYTIEEFMESAKLLKQNFKNAILTTDIIVGFPGETEEEFNITCENIKKIKFYHIHIFKYSKREGTVAAKMDNQVPENIKKERSKKLEEIQNLIQKEILEKFKTKDFSILMEELKKDKYIGHTKSYIPIYINKDSKILKYIDKFLDINNNEDVKTKYENITLDIKYLKDKGKHIINKINNININKINNINTENDDILFNLTIENDYFLIQE